MRAVVDHGEIRTLEPLPEDWQDGHSLQIEKVENRDMTAEEIERDFAIQDGLCSLNDPADEETLERALREADVLAKELARSRFTP